MSNGICCRKNTDLQISETHELSLSIFKGICAKAAEDAQRYFVVNRSQDTLSNLSFDNDPEFGADGVARAAAPGDDNRGNSGSSKQPPGSSNSANVRVRINDFEMEEDSLHLNLPPGTTYKPPSGKLRIILLHFLLVNSCLMTSYHSCQCLNLAVRSE